MSRLAWMGMAGRGSSGYGRPMSRLICLSFALILSLLAATAEAAPQKKPVPRWKGYGFLPGYQQPLSNSVPLFRMSRADQRRARVRRPWYIDRTPRYVGWDGELRYLGRPGFYRGNYNGGSFGPCWTQTPIGPVWNCGN
jgi:hypothetical protein